MTLVRQLISHATTLQSARRMVERLLGWPSRPVSISFVNDGYLDPP